MIIYQIFIPILEGPKNDLIETPPLFIKYVLYLYYLLDIICYHKIKEKTDIVSIGTKLQSSSVNSPELAFCHVTGVYNGKYCVCLRNPKSSTISDYSSELM